MLVLNLSFTDRAQSDIYASVLSNITFTPYSYHSLRFQDLRHLYDTRRLATSYNKKRKYWFTCGLVYVRNTKKVGICVSMKSLHFPEPCQNPIKRGDGTYECRGIQRVTLVSKKPFCCHRWILSGDKCATCEQAESNGDQRSWCNKSSSNCKKCEGRIFCKNSKMKKNSVARNLYKHRCCWGGSSCAKASTCTATNHWCSMTKGRCSTHCENGRLCPKNAVPRKVPTNTRVLVPATSRSTALTGASILLGPAPVPEPQNRIHATRTASNDLETKSSIFFRADSNPSTVSTDDFFMRITPVMPTGQRQVCSSSILAPGGCQGLCWYVSAHFKHQKITSFPATSIDSNSHLLSHLTRLSCHAGFATRRCEKSQRQPVPQYRILQNAWFAVLLNQPDRKEVCTALAGDREIYCSLAKLFLPEKAGKITIPARRWCGHRPSWRRSFCAG